MNASPFDVAATPAGIAWNPTGQLLVLARDDRLLAEDPAGRLSTVDRVAVDGAAPCNELTADQRGTIYVGIFGLATGALMHRGTNGAWRIATDNLLLPNGQGLSADGQTLLVAESASQRITAFIVRADGTLCERRTWAALGNPATARALPELQQQLSTWLDGIALDGSGVV